MSWNHTEFVGVHKNSERNVSTVMVTFNFQREQGFYLLQVRETFD